MIKEGYFNQNGEPVVNLDLISASVEALIDTGFFGSLIVTRMMASDLDLQFEGVEEFYTVTGEMFTAPSYFTKIRWFGEEVKMPIAISDEISEALLGTRMLQGCRLTIDYAERAVIIEKAAAAERL
jgi:clan AA aspartic protease